MQRRLRIANRVSDGAGGMRCVASEVLGSALQIKECSVLEPSVLASEIHLSYASATT